MKEVSYNGKIFEVFIPEEKIQEIVSRLAEDISSTYASSDEPIVLISILDGSFIFMADLVRKIRVPVTIQFVKLQSYDDTTSRGEVAHLLKLQSSLSGKHVIVVEDIIDTGLTLEVFLEELKKKNPLSTKICTLLSKPEVHNDIIDIDYVGLDIGPDFVIGYGLDINGEGRQHPDIYRLKVE